MICAKKLLGSIDLENPEVVFCERCGKGPCVETGTWREKVAQERERLGGRRLSLNELLALAKAHNMTPEEIEAQRQSWLRQDKD